MRVIGAMLLAGCSAQPLVAGTVWNQFRGPNGQGVAEDARPPVTFSPQNNVVWKAVVGQGHSSPVAWENRIVFTTFHDREVETVGLDRDTGREVWRKAVTPGKLQRTHEMSNAASTPAMDKDRLYIYFCSYGVVCYEHDGKDLWHRNLPAAKIHYGGAPSPILHDRKLILPLDADDGSSQEWKNALADFVNLQPALVAVRSGAAGDARKTPVAWEIRRHIPEIPSPLYYRKRLYLVSDGGLFTCLDPANGKDLFSERLDAPGQYAASPVAADGRIYTTSEKGVITVLAASGELHILAKNDLGEKIFATPALHERCLYARTTSHLYAFGE